MCGVLVKYIVSEYQWLPTVVPRSDALEASKILFGFFWLNILASKCRVAMILGKKLRDHRQILSEDLFFLEITTILGRKLRNH